ncbi:E3 binding domain-containing protein [Mycobacteroides abscessus]|uniref:E3 binding domain-containing protein n=1 Tax=Mycobacteroides abscessus TaxID=36809 RepID=UPI001EEEAD80|nr:E3 binding domain-containing protein [Mycobacteroides abscessus]
MAPISAPAAAAQPAQTAEPAPAPEPVYAQGTVVGAVDVAPVVAPVVAAPSVESAAAQAVSVPVSDSVRAFAARHNIDLSTVTGTGSRGRITRKDLEAIVAAAAALSSEAPVAEPEVAAAPAAEPVAPPVVPAPSPASVAPVIVEPTTTPVEPAPAPAFSAPIVAAPSAIETPTPSALTPAAPADSSPSQVVSGGLNLRVPIDLSAGNKFAFDAGTDLVALARDVLPALNVLSAFVELTVEGPALVVTVAATTAVSL